MIKKYDNLQFFQLKLRRYEIELNLALICRREFRVEFERKNNEYGIFKN